MASIIENNLAKDIGQTCRPTWTSTAYHPVDQLQAARFAPVGQGFVAVPLANGDKLNYRFDIICFKTCLVPAPDAAVRVVSTLEKWMTIPVPWTTTPPAIDYGFKWCTPVYSCPGPKVRDGGQTDYYPPNVIKARVLCLPMYNSSPMQIPGQKDWSTAALDANNRLWRTFWLAVGDAAARHNAGEPPIR